MQSLQTLKVIIPKLPALTFISSVAKLLHSNALQISLYASSLGLLTVVNLIMSGTFITS